MIILIQGEMENERKIAELVARRMIHAPRKIGLEARGREIIKARREDRKIIRNIYRKRRYS